jgi:ATP-dependent Clp protease ATP-binding subunit ClpA
VLENGKIEFSIDSPADPKAGKADEAEPAMAE